MPHDLSAWARISPYLDQALDLAAGERASWLEQLEQTDVQIARTVRNLLGEIEALNHKGYLEKSPLLSTSLNDLMPALEQMVRERVEVESGEWLQNQPGVAQSMAREDRQPGLATVV